LKKIKIEKNTDSILKEKFAKKLAEKKESEKTAAKQPNGDHTTVSDA
jgi:hypothetical protein